ncbi:MAG: FHA domain-containing protein [Proteobacteria bacterium]|nr:FHA domain-containing protein [Pseudomonadota bacterium]
MIAKGVSRLHASLTIEPGGVFIEDLGSSNGTFVGARQLTGKHRLVLGGRFRVGDAVFELIEGEGNGASADDEFELKLASGPAESETALGWLDDPSVSSPAPSPPNPQSPTLPTSPPTTPRVTNARTSAPTVAPIGCGHPLHGQAIRDKWRHCPHCGKSTI